MAVYRQLQELTAAPHPDYVQISATTLLKRSWIKCVYDDAYSGWLVVRHDGVAEKADEQHLRGAGLL